MQILTDILSLFKRKQFVTDPTPDDLVVLGRHEEPDMLGVASPIPYKSVKLIKVKDLISENTCTHTNLNNGTGTNPVGIFASKTTDPSCSINLRSICGTGNNISVTKNANEIEISTTGEPNNGVNLGSGVRVFENKVGENLRFRTLTSSDNSVTITESDQEIDIVCSSQSSGSAINWARYNGASSFEGDAFVTISDGAFVQPMTSPTVVSQGTTPNFNQASGKFEFTNSDLNHVYTFTVVFKSSAANANQTHVDIAFTAQGDYARLGKSIGFYKGNETIQNFHEMFQFYVDEDLVSDGLQVNIGADGGDIKIGDVIFFINKL